MVHMLVFARLLAHMGRLPLHMCTCIWRPEAEAGSLPQFLYTSHIEAGSLADPQVPILASLAGQLPCLFVPLQVTGLPQCLLGFYVDLRGLNDSLHDHGATGLPVDSSSQPLSYNESKYHNNIIFVNEKLFLTGVMELPM